jgi:tannase/feruloyl esterase
MKNATRSVRVFFRALAVGLPLLMLAPAHPRAEGGSCAALAKLAVPNATITLAQPVEPGAFSPPGAGGAADSARVTTAFCRVAATLQPTRDSDIKIEVWMPASGWNGKLLAVGNGAFSGAIAYSALASALARGYAASSTDTGHTGGSASFALGHPEKVIDFGWRAVHEMTVAVKAFVGAFYGVGPRFSYWSGCSAGGRQGLKEAQRFPQDFDGIVAGAPGLDWTGRAAQAARVASALERNEAARLSRAQTALLHRAVLQACDALDGVADGIIDDPTRCTFDPAVLECKGADGVPCLTTAQVETARLLYSSATNPKTKRSIAGLARGSELGWTDLGWSASARATGLDQFRFIVFKDPSWEIRKFTFETDIVLADEADALTINALDPNLAPFIERGGKLIQYHGWSDPQISPGNSVQYYASVLDRVGGASKVEGAYRLFMAPGMAHCGGGEGPNTFDMIGALERWVEQGAAPDRIVAARSIGQAPDRTRPLCPYPRAAVYKGTGSTDQAASFECRAR